MLIKIKRLNTTKHSTIGTLSIDGEFECFTLEDPYHAVKVKGNTRIPNGIYKLGLRTEGGLHERYSEIFGNDHKGMIWLRDVPNFTYIYIHIGNTHEHTAGCPLVGDSLFSNVDSK